MEFCKMATTQKICVYLDYATIPSLNYILHFAQHFEDQETIRLFGLSRFHIPESVIQRYPKGVVQFYPNQEKDFSALLLALKNILIEVKQQQRKCEIELHLNLFHYQLLLLPFLSLYLDTQDYCHLTLKFYDDGSEAISALQELALAPDLAAQIQFEKQQFDELVVKKSFKLSLLSRYFWGKLFESEYIWFNQAILQKAELQILKQEISSSRQMDFAIYQQMSDEQKQLVLEILNIDLNKVAYLKQLMENQPSFLFLGTTLFNITQETKTWLMQMHVDLIQQYCLPSGQFFNNKAGYLCFYKGHPNEKEMNQMILSQFKNLIALPDDIPLEILLLLGVIPSKVGGFASSALFNFTPAQIENIIFFTPRYFEKDNRLHATQYRLMQGLIELGYLDAEKSVTHFEIMQLLTKE
ncbi:hypothetical protein F542_16230 [Bibersteinia trehalosi USDA-ARS-USMARC-188]|uniref:Uncharacterized protein n=4 Tax=Bibersteinia trehalosi TaxID=47735 RepID=W0R3X2_BIBTR|nr:hypothetical protein WQG_5820 [Bibersteinia trehalosi USDA-ARS-USMARC-192]AHG82339.1 hypothetical protein F542_16230 [Bibersteinia trehalosi USDA-ARS-USMARC-188]AHG84654.1 hypothetical protein F543_17920 [Bibersteinia trehalosi USDA-ARS-USMARC-189]AHG85844.1 hypothetical protein F544_6130 [Bibersteinia trehalosi USDA-ARS-USMARC-190]